MANMYKNRHYISVFSFNSNVLCLTNAHLVTHNSLPDPLLQ